MDIFRWILPTLAGQECSNDIYTMQLNSTSTFDRTSISRSRRASIGPSEQRTISSFEDNDDMFEDDFDRKSNDDPYEETYNGIIPNPLLDAMDPDGVYERLGPELFKDWTFWRDMILFAAFLAFFTRDTHHYGTFDSVVEGMERLPANFIR